jgi:hypothetical protein
MCRIVALVLATRFMDLSCSIILRVTCKARPPLNLFSLGLAQNYSASFLRAPSPCFRFLSPSPLLLSPIRADKRTRIFSSLSSSPLSPLSPLSSLSLSFSLFLSLSSLCSLSLGPGTPCFDRLKEREIDYIDRMSGSVGEPDWERVSLFYVKRHRFNDLQGTGPLKLFSFGLTGCERRCMGVTGSSELVDERRG